MHMIIHDENCTSICQSPNLDSYFWQFGDHFAKIYNSCQIFQWILFAQLVSQQWVLRLCLYELLNGLTVYLFEWLSNVLASWLSELLNKPTTPTSTLGIYSHIVEWTTSFFAAAAAAAVTYTSCEISVVHDVTYLSADIRWSILSTTASPSFSSVFRVFWMLWLIVFSISRHSSSIWFSQRGLCTMSKDTVYHMVL